MTTTTQDERKAARICIARNRHIPLYDNTTPAYAAFMARVDKMPKAQLANIVKWVIDDIYGVGEGDPHGPRALDNQQEAATGSDTVMRIAETLYENNLIPPESCECGEEITLDGYDGKCATCADRDDAEGDADTEAILEGKTEEERDDIENGADTDAILLGNQDPKTWNPMPTTKKETRS